MESRRIMSTSPPPHHYFNCSLWKWKGNIIGSGFGRYPPKCDGSGLNGILRNMMQKVGMMRGNWIFIPLI